MEESICLARASSAPPPKGGFAVPCFFRGLAAFWLLALGVLSAGAATVEVEKTSEGMGSVSWSQRQTADAMSSLTLKANANRGFVFAGWFVDGQRPAWGGDARNPSLSGVKVHTNAVVSALFIDSAEDTLQFDFSDDLSELSYGENVSVQLEVDSASYPTLSFQGLPAGLSYDPKTLTVSGTLSTPCWKVVTVNGVNGSGYTFSQQFRSSVGDISSSRLSGVADDIQLGEYYSVEFSDLFSCSDARMSTRITGCPPGLTWKESWDIIYGTPTKTGTYVVKATVKFLDGKTEVATTRIVVSALDPSTCNVDLDGLESLSVGDVVDSRNVEIGTYATGRGIMSVSGLPPGLEVETWTESGVRHYGIAGTVATSGVYVVRVNVSEMDPAGEGSPRTVVAEREIVVSDTPDRYLRVAVSPRFSSGGGTVSGGGVVQVGSSATVTAKAAKNHVFAGWYDSDGECADVGDGVDYRSPRITFGPGTEFDLVDMLALFAASSEDGVVAISGLDGETFSFSRDGHVDETFSVSSLSLPSLTAKGLPASVRIVPDAGSSYRVVYDADAVKNRPAPGRYSVSVTAKNSSGAKDSSEFLMVVANVVDPRIDVDDDYGELSPDEEIDPIDLSGAVDFSKGETLSVTGLPKGLSYNKTANERKGVKAYTITGTPTVPGYYTLTFSAKVVASETTNAAGRVQYAYEKATATAFISVAPYPLLSLSLFDDAAAAGNSVSGGGRYRPGSKVTLKAKAAKGWVFAGWDAYGVGWPASLNPALGVVAGSDDVEVTADFVPVSEDMLEILEPYESESGFAAELEKGVDVSGGDNAAAILDLVYSVSYPTVVVSGLPPGVSFSPSTLLLSGKPKKAGVYYVTVKAKNGGGYKFTRILRFAVYEPGAPFPTDVEPANDAGIDFSPLAGLVTGTYYAQGAASVKIGPSPVGGAVPKKVSVTGIPSGLKAVVVQDGDALDVSFVGTPTKVARYAMAVKVTYADKKTLTSKAFVVLEDGGSAYLDVRSLDESLGTVSGAGVYSAGEAVKLVAKPKSKCVFAGWFADSGESEPEPFAPLAEVDGFDFRTSSVSFPFRPGDFSSVVSLTGAFAASSNDTSAVVGVSGDVWEIDPAQSSEFAFSVDSLSLPKVTAKNLPKGVSVDLAHGRLLYTPTDAAKSGKYTASLTAQNQSRASATASFEIRVGNRVCEAITGLDTDMDAYSAHVGVSLSAGFAACSADDGWTVKASGLPSGLKFDAKTGEITGVPKAKTGSYTVVFTASKKGEKNQVATITINVESLPSWVVGTFDGAVNEGGLVRSLVVAANGKISGKLLTDGLVWTLSAPSFEAVDRPALDMEQPVFHAIVIGKSGKFVITNALTFVEDCGRGVATSDVGWIAWQNQWKTEPWKAVAKPFAKAPSLPVEVEDGIVTLKFASSGNVTAAGRFVTGIDSRGKDVIYSTTCSSVLIPTEADGDSLSTHSYLLYLYFSPKKDKFEGFAAIISLVWDGESFALEGQGD